ncbi:cation transporting ATPase C-terminal domain-containing protein [Halomonas sp. CS7]|uniref:Cation transporting ATPase C-terminal domain-containing protein n=1 Tax=Halomonas pelophila TaxID=3151122 RepID=A0ABV1N983_9GAMM
MSAGEAAVRLDAYGPNRLPAPAKRSRLIRLLRHFHSILIYVLLGSAAITAITLGIALAFESTEADTMRRPPRPRHQPLLTGELTWHIVLVSALFSTVAVPLQDGVIIVGVGVALLAITEAENEVQLRLRQLRT